MDQVHIAIAEDDPIDLALFRTVLDRSGVKYMLTIAKDGEEARDFILKQGHYRGLPPADVIFLDLNLPKLTGLEVLQQIAGSEDLPVCLLTDSKRGRQTIDLLFAPKTVCYLTKPIDVEHLLECFRSHEHLRPIADRLIQGNAGRTFPSTALTNE